MISFARAAKQLIKRTSGSLFEELMPLRCFRGLRIVLVYHHVLPSSPAIMHDPAMYVTADTFAMHLDQTSKFFEIVPIETLLSAERVPTKNLCAITFDDGFEDSYTVAYPILKRHRLPATIFLTVSAVEEKGRYWFDDLFLLANQIDSRRRADAFMEYWSALAPSWSPRGLSRDSVCDLIQSLKTLTGDVQDAAVTRAFECLGMARPAESAALNWDHAEEMAEHGILFGSHGLRHVLLPQLDREEKRRNISESMRLLSGRSIPYTTVFSYPNGDWDLDSIQFLKKAGHSGAVTMTLGCMNGGSRFTLPRVAMHEYISHTPGLFWHRILQARFSTDRRKN